MLHGSVLHQNPGGGAGGASGGKQDIVGISWKPVTRAHSSSSLVVTCTHQVVVYKAGETRRTHQWSFKPSASTVLSHATVFLPASARYVGVQRGSTLVTWRESEQDIKRPLSAKSPGLVQAVHGYPQLGDVFVVVLASGAVSLYEGGLKSLAEHDAAAGVNSDGPREDLSTTVLWSGVQGNRIIVVEKKHAEATARVTTFVISASSHRVSGAAAALTTARASDGGAKTSVITAAITLASSHVLPRPARPAATVIAAETSVSSVALARDGVVVDEEAEVCSAAFLTGTGVLSVAWRSPRGPLWTKVVVSASGAREEFSRPAGVARLMVTAQVPALTDGSSAVVVGLSNGQKPGKTPKKGAAKRNRLGTHVNDVVVQEGNGDDNSAMRNVPALAAGEGGRLLVHSGGECPRLATWDATYGVLLDYGDAPDSPVVDVAEAGTTVTSKRGKASAKSAEKPVSMIVAGDEAHVALAVGGRVFLCPLPAKEMGTLASLLRRKRPSAVVSAERDGKTVGVGHSAQTQVFPSVDLARSAIAAQLLGRTGALLPAEWEVDVVTPFREAESKVVRSLEDAARRKDGEGFERALRQHIIKQQRMMERVELIGNGVGDRSGYYSGAGGIDAEEDKGNDASGDGTPGRKKRRRDMLNRVGGGAGCSPGVLTATIELCLANPDSNLWGALGLLVKSGGVSARQHRGLVGVIVKHGPSQLLEEVMLYVPDLPEADAVRILRHFLAQAAVVAKQTKSSTSPLLLATTDAAVQPLEDTREGEMNDDGDRDRAVGIGVGVVPIRPLTKRPRGGDETEEDVVDSAAKVAKVPKKGVVSGNGDGEGELTAGITVTKLSSNKVKGGVVGIVNTMAMAADKEESFLSAKHKIAKKQQDNSPSTSNDDGDDEDGEDIKNPHKGSNGTILANGYNHKHHHPSGRHEHDGGGGTSSDSGGVSDGDPMEACMTQTGRGEVGTVGDEEKKRRFREEGCGDVSGVRSAGFWATPAAVQAERGVRVALTLPYNEAFLRSALARFSHGEVVIVLKILTRLLSEGRTQETAARSKHNRSSSEVSATRGLPPARTSAVLGWASAVLDAHFTRLAIAGAVDASVLRALQALKRTTVMEAECCDLLCQVRSLVDELGRSHLAAQEERRRPKNSLYSIRELRF